MTAQEKEKLCKYMRYEFEDLLEAERDSGIRLAVLSFVIVIIGVVISKKFEPFELRVLAAFLLSACMMVGIVQFFITVTAIHKLRILSRLSKDSYSVDEIETGYRINMGCFSRDLSFDTVKEILEDEL